MAMRHSYLLNSGQEQAIARAKTDSFISRVHNKETTFLSYELLFISHAALLMPHWGEPHTSESPTQVSCRRPCANNYRENQKIYHATAKYTA